MEPDEVEDDHNSKRSTSETLREGEEGGREMFSRSATSQEEQILEMALVSREGGGREGDGWSGAGEA